MNFAHVENNNLRSLLERSWDGDEDTICQALHFSSECVAADAFNELLDMRIVEARSAALDNAVDAWNEEVDGFAAVDYLRELWLI
jgi:hypothetical protein